MENNKINGEPVVVLLVDDEEAHADLITRSFESNTKQTSVTVARNLHEARTSIAKSTPDLIIADYVLPDGRGIELIPDNREEPPYPIVIMTSHGDEKVAVETMKAGAFDYIVKSSAVLADMSHICERIMREWSHIIKQRKAEERIRHISKQLQLSISQMPIAYILWDSNNRVLEWNKAAENIFGYTRDEIMGKSMLDAIVPDNVRHLAEEAGRELLSGKPSSYSKKNNNVRKDGRLISCLWYNTPLHNRNGEIITILSMAQDITEKLKMEEALLQSEKLQSLGTVTAGVSHEFNNILAVIYGNVQLLEGSRKDDKELMEALRTIKRAAKDGAEISRRMLKFTKTAKDTAGFAPFDINELLNQALDFTMPRWKNAAQAKGKNYYVNTEGMKRVPYILCNPAELREVFVNIINNALDAMPHGGIITVATRYVRSEELGVESKKENVYKLKGNFVEITFADNGEGMSGEVKKNIFDPFFTTKTAVGTGLGMSMAYGIVSRHGGRMEVESEAGRGSVFTLQIPAAAKADSPEESPEKKQEIKSNSLCILVVDDNEEICNILDKFFSNKGHLVRTVDNGREAIILTKVTDYDLVLCDMAMPEVFGYDVIKALNKLEKRPKIGIITGWEGKLMPLDDEELKVDFIIKKPFNLSELTSHINSLEI